MILDAFKELLMRNFVMIMLVAVFAISAGAQPSRPADKIAMDVTAHFQVEANESKDFAIPFAAGEFVVVLDLKRSDGMSSNITGGIKLLKSNGSIVNDNILHVNVIHVINRSMASIKVASPFTARLRVMMDQQLEGWITVVPAAKMHFVPFGFPNGELLPLAIGNEQAKGGELEPHSWAFHTIKLPAGKWNVSLYLAQTDNNKTNLQGNLQQLTEFGVIEPNTEIHMNEVDLEARKERMLVLTKPRTLIFRVSTEERKLKYDITIEKAE